MRLPKLQTILAICVVLLCSIVGSVLFMSSRAATLPVAVEVETGVVTAPAVSVDDPSASSSKAIRFAQPPSPPPPAPTPPPTPAPTGKPTDVSTGPRIASLVSTAGGTLSGSHSGKRFTSQVIVNGTATFTDCIFEKGFQIFNGPVLVEYSDISGWWGVTTDNTDPNKAVFTMRHSKSVGPLNGDAIRIGAYSTFGDHSKYTNTLIEDSILNTPYNSFGAEDHFDLLQFGGGRNATFNRTVFSYSTMKFGPQATNYINNGAYNINVRLTDIWIEGGPVGYVLSGPMTVTNCTIGRSTMQYGFVYPAKGTVLSNCKDDAGAVINGTGSL